MRIRKQLAGVCCAIAALAAEAAGEPAQLLADFSRPETPNQVTPSEAVCTPLKDGLRVETRASSHWPGLALRPASGTWDLSRNQKLVICLRNPNAEPLKIHARLDDRPSEPKGPGVTAMTTLAPHATGTLELMLTTLPFRLSKPLELVGMRGFPGQRNKIDLTQATHLRIFLNKPSQPNAFELLKIETCGAARVLDADTFLPFVDEFGQFKHDDWPGKLHTATDFAQRIRQEDADFKAHPAPADRDAFGGWASGPKLAASGFFRTAKLDGRWWLVDPEGHLFWSYGVDSVQTDVSTPLTDRTQYFASLPPHTPAFAAFYGHSGHVSVGYYTNAVHVELFNFAGANLLRKYGLHWRTVDAERTQHRLQSWGLNTIGNWSDKDVCRLRRTPYVATISIKAPPIEGSHGYWGKFPDPFHEQFTTALRRAMKAEHGAAADDPWCLGAFVQNELAWGDDTSLAEAALKSPAQQPAKLAFIGDLKAKYGDIAKLNAAWGTQHESWDALLNTRTAPDHQRAQADLEDFYTRIAERYFEVCRTEVKRVMPHQLYLGCRFAWHNDRAVRTAAKYCDVLSFNRYEYSVAEDHPPEGIDLPMIIGEFHFGALDRGLFHPGLKATKDQNDRAVKYREYLEGALKNPWLVGAHWFEFRDEPLTGRFDGENFQIGLVDICDTPYPELIEAVRDIGARMYPLRASR